MLIAFPVQGHKDVFFHHFLTWQCTGNLRQCGKPRTKSMLVEIKKLIFLVYIENPKKFRSCQFLIKLNMQLAYHPVTQLLGIYAREMKTYVYTNPYTEMFTSTQWIFVHNSPKLEVTQMPFVGEWSKKLFHPYYWYHSAIKWAEYWCVQPRSVYENYAEWEKPIWKDYIMFNSILITFLKWQNHKNGEQSSGSSDGRRVAIEGQHQGFW